MGNQQGRAVEAIKKVTPPIIGEFMLEELRKTIMCQKVFQILFGGGDDQTDPEKSHIFLNKATSYNETLLPAWEFRFFSETSQGTDLLMPGRLNSRIIFPNNLQGDLNFHRKVALTVARFFNADDRLKDFVANVSGLTEFGENLDIRYDLMFVQGAMKVPVITIGIDYIFDIRRFRLENQCTDYDADLDADLIKEITNKIQIDGDDQVTGTRPTLIPASDL